MKIAPGSVVEAVAGHFVRVTALLHVPARSNHTKVHRAPSHRVQQRELRAVTTIPHHLRRHGLVEPFIYLKKSSFYQDRLGTNIGKPLKKEWLRFESCTTLLAAVRDTQVPETAAIPRPMKVATCPPAYHYHVSDDVYIHAPFLRIVLFFCVAPERVLEKHRVLFNSIETPKNVRRKAKRETCQSGVPLTLRQFDLPAGRQASQYRCSACRNRLLSQFSHVCPEPVLVR